MKGPLGDLERAKQGEVLFYREPELPPGVYTMETVVLRHTVRKIERAVLDGRSAQRRC